MKTVNRGLRVRNGTVESHAADARGSKDQSTMPIPGANDQWAHSADHSRPPKLLDALRALCRFKHYSLRTEEAYTGWVRRFIIFHGKRHPRDLGEAEIRAYLTYLATERNVSASTQNQALSALLFLYKELLQISLGWVDDFERAKKPQRLPVVLTEAEAIQLLAQLQGLPWLLALLLYGAGLRLMEALRLRVKDLEFDYHQILVRDGKGGKDRITLLPEAAILPLKTHLREVRLLHENDLACGHGDVWLPAALARKYPNASRQWMWHLHPHSQYSWNLCKKSG
jgi:integron integrase